MPPPYQDYALPPDVAPDSRAAALYNPNGGFPDIGSEEELDRMVELYRPMPGSRTPLPEAEPPAALRQSALTALPVTTGSEDLGAGPDYGGGGDVTTPVVAPTEEAAPTSTGTIAPPSTGGKWVGEPIFVGTKTPEAESAGWGQIFVRGATRAKEDLSQGVDVAKGGKPKESDIPQASYEQPLELADFADPMLLAKKTFFGLARSSPAVAASMVGSLAGGAIGGAITGPGAPIGATVGGIGGGALGMGFGAALQEIGPAYAAELQATPNDIDGAWDRALATAAKSGVIGAGSMALFGAGKPLSNFLKSFLAKPVAEGAAKPVAGMPTRIAVQAVGQPAVAVGGEAGANVIEGKPVGENLDPAAAGSIVNVGQDVLSQVGGRVLRGVGRRMVRGRPEGETETPPPSETPPSSETPPAEPAPVKGGAPPVPPPTGIIDPAIAAGMGTAIGPGNAPGARPVGGPEGGPVRATPPEPVAREAATEARPVEGAQAVPPPRLAPERELPAQEPPGTGFTMRDAGGAEPMPTDRRPSEVAGEGFTMRNAGGAEPMPTDIRPTEVRGGEEAIPVPTEAEAPAPRKPPKKMTTEEDDVNKGMHVAKNDDAEVIGKGASKSAARADARARGFEPYPIEEAPLSGTTGDVFGRTEKVAPEISPEVGKTQPTAREGVQPRDELVPKIAPTPEKIQEVAGEPAAATKARATSKSRSKASAEPAKSEGVAPSERETGATARDSEPAQAREVLPDVETQAAPEARKTARPAAAEDAIAKSKSKAPASPERQAPTAQPVATPAPPPPRGGAGPTGRTPSVMARPVKRQEIPIGRRGEGVTAEEGLTPEAQAEATATQQRLREEGIARAEAAQQRKLAEQRDLRTLQRPGMSGRTSAMADKIRLSLTRSGTAASSMGGNISTGRRGTPIEETLRTGTGEGAAEGAPVRGPRVESTSIAEQRSKTTTDANLKYGDHLHDLLRGNTKSVREAFERAGSKEEGTRGAPRRNKNLADYIEKEAIPRAEKYEKADQLLAQRATEIASNPKLTQRQKDARIEALGLTKQTRVAARGKHELERERLSDLREIAKEARRIERGEPGEDMMLEARRSRARDQGAEAPVGPLIERSNKLARTLMKLTANKKIRERLAEDDKNGMSSSSHDFLNEFINDPGAKMSSPDMVEYAKHLLRLLPDHVNIGSFETLAHETGNKDFLGLNRRAQGVYNGHYDVIGIRNHIDSRVSHAEAMLHEATHGVTWKYLDAIYQKVKNGESLTPKEQKHKDTLDEIHKEVTRLRDEHAISDEEYNALDYATRASSQGEPAGRERTVEGRHELVTQVMTNPYVRAVMARTEASPEFKSAMKKLGYGEPRTVWQGFKALVKDILGFNKDSVIDRVLDPMTEVLESASDYRSASDMGLEMYAPRSTTGSGRGRSGPPTENLQSQWAREKMRPWGDAVMEAPIFDRVKDRLTGSGPGMTHTFLKAVLPASTTDQIARFNQKLVPAVAQVRDAWAKSRAGAKEFYDEYGDRVQNWSRELRAEGNQPLGKLMNDATMNETYLTNQPNLFEQRNAHLSEEQMKQARVLQDTYSNLPERSRELYDNIRDYYRRTHFEKRQLEYEDIVNKFLPDITPEQRGALADKLRTKAGIKEVIDNPDVLTEAFGERLQNSRGLIKDIARLQDAGWVNGDYFPLRRYGEYTVKYGEYGQPGYGVEMFERSNEAKGRIAELKAEWAGKKGEDPSFQIPDISDVLSKAKHPNRGEYVPESVFEEMQREMTKRGSTQEQISEAKEAYTHAMLRRQVSQTQASSRFRREGIAGASVDAAKNLVNDFRSSGAKIGHLKYGAEEVQAFKDLRQQVKDIEGASGRVISAKELEVSRDRLTKLEERLANKDPDVSLEDVAHARKQHAWLEKPPSSNDTLTARAVLEEMEARHTPVDGDFSTTPMGKNVGRFTKASFLYHLVRPAHLALQVADAHANGMSFMGAEFGYGRTSVAMAKAMRTLAPSGLGRGLNNAMNAMRGELKYSDWNFQDTLLRKMIAEKPGDAAHEGNMRDLFDYASQYGAIDHTFTRELQAMASEGGFEFGTPRGMEGRGWTNVGSNMMNLFAVGEHTVDATNRAVIIKAGYDLARQAGQTHEQARETSLKHAMNAMPVYGAWNTPRIASSRSPLGAIAPATMQYKLYGMHMYAVMGGLVKQAATRSGPERAEAFKALAGLVSTHAAMGGVTAALFSLPVTALLGAYDLISGEEKPHNYENDFNRFATDIGGETVGKFISSGIFGLAGAKQTKSIKLTNMVDVPEISSFDKAGAGKFILQGMTGASGEVAEQLFEATHELFSRNWGRAAKLGLPRVISDPLKAYDLATGGVEDKRGRFIGKPVSGYQAALQATGFNPYEVAIDRSRRFSIEERKNEVQYHRQRAVDRYVNSGGTDMRAVRAYINNKEYTDAMPLKFHDLRQALKKERERERRPELYGATVPKKARKAYEETARFN